MHFRINHRCLKNNISLRNALGYFSQKITSRYYTKNKKQYRVIFYGTDSLSCVTLRALNNNRLLNDDSRIVDSLDVICIKGESPVRKLAKSCDIPIHTWPHSVKPTIYDVGIVVSFGHLIPSKSILACQYGMINAHPSLLPRWRGAAPIVYSVLHGDTETGVTILQVAPKKFDVGKILQQKKCKIPENSTSQTLTAMLADIAAKMVMETLHNLPEMLENPTPQSSDGICYALKLKPEMGCIEWEKSNTKDVELKFRAYTGFIKLYTFWKNVKVLLLEAINPKEAIEAQIDSLVPQVPSPGYCYFHKRRKIVYVKCQDGWTGIKSFSIPIRGKITATDFYCGFISKVKPEECYFKSSVEGNL